MIQIEKIKYKVWKYIRQKEGFTIDPVSFGGNIVQKAAPVAVGVIATVGGGLTTGTVVAVLAPALLVGAVVYGVGKGIEKLTE